MKAFFVVCSMLQQTSDAESDWLLGRTKAAKCCSAQVGQRFQALWFQILL